MRSGLKEVSGNEREQHQTSEDRTQLKPNHLVGVFIDSGRC